MSLRHLVNIKLYYDIAYYEIQNILLTKKKQAAQYCQPKL
jgi:hypothetical protein